MAWYRLNCARCFRAAVAAAPLVVAPAIVVAIHEIEILGQDFRTVGADFQKCSKKLEIK